jgi:hypothetical protein
MQTIHRRTVIAVLLAGGLSLLRATATFAESNPYAAAVLADRPISFHRFEETEGTIAVDATGNGHAGVLKHVQGGDASAYPALGTAFSFNGKNSHVRIPADPAYKVGKGDFSVELWFNCHKTMKARGEVFKFKGEGKDFGFFKPHGNSNLITTARPTQPFQAQTDPFSLGVWHYAVYVRRSGVDHWYVDGLLSGTATGNSLVIDMNVDILIGADHFYGPNRIVSESMWKGLIDEVAIYPVALSAERVMAHFKSAQLRSAMAISLPAQGPLH